MPNILLISPRVQDRILLPPAAWGCHTSILQLYLTVRAPLVNERISAHHCTRVTDPYAEYDFEICYLAGCDDACADFSSRPVEFTVIDENRPFAANLKAIAHYLNNVSIVDESNSITTELKKAKDILIHDERLFRRNKHGIRFVPYIEMRESILKGLHDDVGHWDFNSKYSLVRDPFWWTNMRQEVASFVNGCDTCQKIKPANRKKSLCVISQ